MWSLPLVAVLVAFACASPIPQASENAIGSSTLRSELSSTESSLSSISSSQSTERTTPTRHTLRPFSFSPRTLKTHKPTSHRTFKPLGAKLTTTPVASESTSSISSAAETTSPLNRLGRAAIEGETWQLAESTSTAKVDEITTPSVAPHAFEQSSSSAATTPAVLIGEESTSASTPSTTSLPVRSVRNAEQWNDPSWQLAETSSTASISSSAATPASALIGEESTSASTPSTTSLPLHGLEQSTTAAAGLIGEETTTSALPVRSVRKTPEWAEPGWQLAETSSTVAIDASTTSALNDTSSTPAIGNSMEDAPWQLEESSSTIEAESTSSIAPAVGMSNDDGAPWPQMEESSSTFQAESTSAIPSPAMGNSLDGQNWA